MENQAQRIWVFLLVAIAMVASCRAETGLKVLVNFYGPNGISPVAVLQGTDGNFYGVTDSGGANSTGTFFRITPAGKFNTVYDFCLYCAEGSSPSSLVLGNDGNFYGTTNFGGAKSSECPSRCGTMFKMTNKGALTTLHRFCSEANCADGYTGQGPLLQASDGNFYGTTAGTNIVGQTIFSISPSGTYTTMASFCKDYGCVDELRLQFEDANGALWATSGDGGPNRYGEIALWTASGGLITEYEFDGTSGDIPLLLIQGNDRNYYGTTSLGGGSTKCDGGCGTLFRLTPGGSFAMLHSFNFQDGTLPSSLVQASDGSLYGEAIGGGAQNSGTLFKLTAAGRLTTVYTFCSVRDRLDSCLDGLEPEALMQATNGMFYGPAGGGLSIFGGLVFRYDAGLPGFVKPLPALGRVDDTITILGYRLGGTLSVRFNGVAATFAVVSDTQITATVPEGATNGAIEVTTPTAQLRSNPVFRVR